MIKPNFPKNERERISCVREYKLLDTLPESDFDNITNLVSAICDVPISLITLLDTERNFLKSHHGLDINESPRDISFCGHAILHNDPIFIVEDSREDERFKDNPLIEGFKAIFYAGVPLRNEKGLALGTLCVYDHEPRTLSKNQKSALIALGNQVMNLFELRLKNRLLDEAQQELTIRNAELNTFASHVSHDLKSPLSNIISLTELLKEENNNKLTEESATYLNYIEESADTLKEYIDGILLHYKASELVNAKNKDVKLESLFENVKNILILKSDEFKYPTQGTAHNINEAAITQILLNLVDNAFKYNNKVKPLVTVNYNENKDSHIFSVTDNGQGIANDKKETIFKLFNNLDIKDAKGKKGTGIGLFTVKSLVKKLGGEIRLESELSKGSTFTFTVSK
ncbi:sensor histidine kinase [Lacinutrix salivirga]